MRRSVVITGCSSGFGRILVQLFLKEGWFVIAGLRAAQTRSHLFKNELGQYASTLKLVECDLLDESSIETFCSLAQTLSDDLIHCLVNNAGIGSFGPAEETSTAVLRETMETNFFGTVNITKKLLPNLRKASGHIIVVSSSLGLVGFPLTSSYCASKFALEGYFESLYYELAGQSVKVCLVEPGGHRTDFLSNSKMSQNDLESNSPYQKFLAGYRTMQTKIANRKPVSPEGVCLKILELAQTSNPPLRSHCGKDAQGLRFIHAIIPRNLAVKWLRNLYRNVFSKLAAKGDKI